MRIVLLTRNNDFQIFCANSLWNEGVLNAVIFEEGYCFAREPGVFGDLSLVRKIGRILPFAIVRPAKLGHYARYYFSRKKYFGCQEEHNMRILKHNYKVLAEDVPSMYVPDINSPQVKKMFMSIQPQIVFVFGTRLIDAEMLDTCQAAFVNMHWGWSPDYRGEGIICALASEGIRGLGVTVHFISTKIDGGDILYQLKPSIDENDNFYSIGLKLTVLGVQLFKKCIDTYRVSGELVGMPQELEKGKLYDSAYVRQHPELYQNAWRNLKKM